eukprot:4288772-Pleurochrysis_carterae.AAC.1
MRDELLPDNCSGQEFADNVNKLIMDHNPYIQVPYAGERLGRLIIKFLPAALAGEGRALLQDLFDINALGKEGCVIEEAVRLVKMAHVAVPVSAAYKGQTKKDKKAIAAAATGRKGSGAPGGAPRGCAPYELPNGQWCSKGSHVPLYTRQGQSWLPMLPGSALARPSTRKVLKNKEQVERIKNARENNAKRLQVANLPICSAFATGQAGEEVIDVNGIE